MKSIAKSTFAVLGLVVSNLAIAQGGPSTLHAPPDAKQYLPYGVSTPLLTGVTANGTAFDYRNDRKRVAHFWKTYAHRPIPVAQSEIGFYGSANTSTYANIATNWTGDLHKCVTGTISNGINEASVRQLNWYRAMMGVAPVVIGGAADILRAQQSALVIASGVAVGLPLSHTPNSAYPCLNAETLENAGKTQLAGASGPDYVRGPFSVDAWLDDFGAINFQAPHRQVITSPLVGSVAYGEANIPVSNPKAFSLVGALETRLSPNPLTSADVLWPNAGYVPFQAYPLISNRWSMGCAGCDFSTATVSARRNGVTTPTRIEKVESVFSGLPALIWEMQGVPYHTGLLSGVGYPIQDDVFDVTITYKKNGQPKTKTYRTTVFNPEVDTDFVPPFDVTDLYWVPTESGWGVKMAQSTDGNLFGAVYFYDEAGNPRWMTIQGAWTAPGVFSGKLYTTRGPGFNATSFNPALVQVQEAGTGTLTFSQDTQSVRFDFTMGNQVASKQMVRFNNIPEGYRDGSNYRGLWWNANESGWGLTMQHYYNSLFVAWFTYNPDGSQVWVTFQGDWTSATTYEGKLYQVKQAGWNPASFNPNATNVTEVGTAKLTFTDVNRATFDYAMKGVTGKKLIEKFEF